MPRVAVVFTGGTIAMRHDPAAGGPVPVLHGADILARTAGLEAIADVEAVDWGLVPASHLTLDRVLELAAVVRLQLERPGVDGAVLVQGTDTIEETAFALDLVHGSEKPLVVTGAMRNAGEDGYDGPSNLRGAVRCAAEPALRGQGVLVVMAGEIHAADAVVKTHTDAIAAFRSPDLGPLGFVADAAVADAAVADAAVTVLRARGRRRALGRVPERAAEPVVLVTAVSGGDGELVRLAARASARGFVVAATGAGNTAPDLLDACREAMRAGVRPAPRVRSTGSPAAGGPGRRPARSSRGTCTRSRRARRSRSGWGPASTATGSGRCWRSRTTGGPGGPDSLEGTALTDQMDDAIRGVVESARRMGVEIDEEDASRWVEAMEVEARGGDLVVDVDTGTYGHRVSMLDFQPTELARFREIGKIVGIADRAGTVVTALAISGSAAQGRIQAYPGDCDYFERVHIKAPTRGDACRIAADVIREKALSTLRGPTHRLWEVKFGSYPWDGERDGNPVRRGGPVSWNAGEVVAGQFDLRRADGSAATLTWEEASAEPGWCKLDWIVSDPARHGLANASNMLDVTWEAPDGTITALDGFVDPYFQEVYLEPESLPLFERLIKELRADAVDEYVRQLEHEVHKYVVDTPSYGKAARRMYNIFRLTGRYADAAYLRELFDEPATALYQLAALVRTVDEAAAPGGDFDTEMLVGQVDQLIMAAIAGLEGQAESQVVTHLLHVRDCVSRFGQGVDRAADVREVASEALAAVNIFFLDRLNAVDSIRAYLDAIRAGEGTNPA